jgi:hypothetical protein
MRTFVCVCALAVLAAAAAAGAAPPNLTHKFMGWYGGGAYPGELRGWSNAYMTTHVADLVANRASFSQQLLNVQGVFLYWNYTQKPAPGNQLRPTWRKTLADAAPLWSELLANGTIVGFFLGDELMWNGFPYAELVAYSDAMRAAFPSAFLWENEASSVYKNTTKYNTTKVPPALNATSVDIYDFTGHLLFRSVYVDRVRSYYDTYLKPKLSPGQKLFVIPGADGSTHNKYCDKLCYSYITARDAALFTKWVSEDATIAGAMPWTWASCGPGCDRYHDETGCRGVPKCKAAWEKYGAEITHMPF